MKTKSNETDDTRMLKKLIAEIQKVRRYKKEHVREIQDDITQINELLDIEQEYITYMDELLTWAKAKLKRKHGGVSKNESKK